MNDDQRLAALLDELTTSQRSPEEVCSTCPELLPLVRRRWRQMSQVRAQLDALFPPSSNGKRPLPRRHAEEPATPELDGYQIEAVLGRGGMGVVYRARHVQLNRTVALKMLLAGKYAFREESERFLQEAKLVAGFVHPNVVQLYSVGETDGRPYFTMELVEGGCLAHKLSGTPLPADRAAALIAELAMAVEAAHQHGIIHRDLKPANILLTTEGTPKVSDFGLARQQDSGLGLTMTGAPLGTPSYMAPEQARGDKSAIGPATDIYSLGAILYECLTGRPPFKAETTAATLQQVLVDDPAPPSQLNPRVPRDLETICLKCLEKDRRQRYESAAALADDLHRFQRHDPIAARPAGPLERATKWARRRPATAMLAAAAFLMLAGTTAAGIWYVDQRARLLADRQSRATRVKSEAAAALEVAETHLRGLRDRLDDPPQAWELLSDIDRWQRLVERARNDWERAKSATVVEETLLPPETRARIERVESAVAREEAAFELAKELDTIAVDALGSWHRRLLLQQKAVADYERVFSRERLDIHETRTAEFVSAIRSSPARASLLAALDNWAMFANTVGDSSLVERLLEITRAADPDEWRDRFRDPALWRDRESRTQLAKEVDVARQSPTVLASLVCDLHWSDQPALLEAALLAHERDFWLLLHGAIYATDPASRGGLAHAALSVRPENVRALMLLSWSLNQREEWQAGMAAANRAIEIDANSAWGYCGRGDSLRALNDLSGAIAAYEKSAELDPAYPDPCWRLGDLFRVTLEPAKAADSYRQAAERDGTAAGLLKLGGSLRALNDELGATAAFQAAIEWYQKLIDHDSRDATALHGRGEGLCQLRQYNEAEQAYLRAIEANPAFEPVYGSLARLLATCPDCQIRDGKRAVEYATTACDLTHWKTSSYLEALAAAYAEIGDFKEAILYQVRALELPTPIGEPRAIAKYRLELYRKGQPLRDAGL
jgi:serine/threonine-protein kinase